MAPSQAGTTVHPGRRRQRLGHRRRDRAGALVLQPAETEARHSVPDLRRRGTGPARLQLLREPSGAAARQGGGHDQHGHDRPDPRRQGLRRRGGTGSNLASHARPAHCALSDAASITPTPPDTDRAITPRSPPSRCRCCSSSPDCTATITSRATPGTRSTRRTRPSCCDLVAEVGTRLCDEAERPQFVRVKEPDNPHAGAVAGSSMSGYGP